MYVYTYSEFCPKAVQNWKIIEAEIGSDQSDAESWSRYGSNEVIIRNFYFVLSNSPLVRSENGCEVWKN